MSYLRCGSVYKYVEGTSKDYIYPALYKKGKKTIREIVDYGNISNETLVELLFRYTGIKDVICPKHDLKGYLLNKVAERLNVKLRKSPLTTNQSIKIYENNFNEWKKKNKKWLDELGNIKCK